MTELQKVLSFRSILLITINSVLGTGIFFLPAIGAAELGTASFWAWAIMGVVALYLSMVFAELVGMFPKSGGVYEFSKQTFNAEISFFVGYITLIIGYITIAMLIVGAVSYLIPNAPIFITTAIALVLIILFHVVAYTGMQTSTMMLLAFSLITLVALGIVIYGSIVNFSWLNVKDIFVITETGTAWPIMLFSTVFLVAETFFGWETATFLAGETKNGAKVVPKALIIGTIIMVIISLVLVFVSLGGVGAQGLADNLASPFSFMGISYFGEEFNQPISLLVYLAIIGSVAGWVVSSPRLICAMAQDKLFISQLSHIHPKFLTPGNAIIFQGILVSILIVISSSSYETLLHLLIPLVLVQYGIVVLMQVVLRYKRPDVERTFTIPGPKWLSLWIIPVFILFTLTWVTHIDGAFRLVLLGVSFIFTGFPIFLLLKVYYDPHFFIKLNDFFAWFVYLTERVNMPKEVIDEIFLLLGPIRGKRVLEYGNSVGTLTVALAEHVSKDGVIYATNISSKELSISQKRITRRGHEHVVFIHDEHQVNRVSPEVPEVDVIVSLGMLSAIQDIKKVIKEMSNTVVEGGKIVLVDYTNYFHLIPDVDWVTSDATIKQMFEEAGFRVSITRRKGKLWNYVYIHGIKAAKGYEEVPYI